MDKLGPMPDPEVEPPEDNPGGADAINQDPPFSGDEEAVLSHDLHPDHNPGVQDAMPEEVGEPEDKQQENESSDGASKPEEEAPA